MAPYIARVYPIDRFLDIIKSKSIAFVKPEIWSDPWEGFFLNRNIKTRTGSIRLQCQKSIFALCFSTRIEETDFVWRLYSPESDGVFVVIDQGYLVDTIIESTYGSAEVRSKVITYRPVEFINGKHKEFFMDADLDELVDPEGDYQALMLESLFTKREHFKYEEEYRIVIDFEKEQFESPIIKIRIDPNKLFKHIVLDHRMTKGNLSQNISQLKQLGFTRKIQISTINDNPTFVIPESEIDDKTPVFPRDRSQ